MMLCLFLSSAALPSSFNQLLMPFDQRFGWLAARLVRLDDQSFFRYVVAGLTEWFLAR